METFNRAERTVHIKHHEELHNLDASPKITTVIKSMRIRWARHVARMGEMRNECNNWVGKLEGKTLA
jgi:hypothetical protein